MMFINGVNIEMIADKEKGRRKTYVLTLLR